MRNLDPVRVFAWAILMPALAAVTYGGLWWAVVGFLG